MQQTPTIKHDLVESIYTLEFRMTV